MASNDLEEEARYVDVKQNGKHLEDTNKFTYRKVRARAKKMPAHTRNDLVATPLFFNFIKNFKEYDKS